MRIKIREFATRIFVLAGLAVSSGIYAQAPVAKAPATAKKCFMWKAVSGSNVVYLLGSIHIGTKKMYPLPSVIEDAYTRSKVLVVEVNVNKVDSAKTMSFVSENGMYKGGDTLFDHLEKSTVQKLKNYCAKYNIDSNMLSMFKPWLASVQLEVMPMLKSGFDMNLGIDKHFLDRASSSKTPKPIEQLETADFQLKLLSSMPEGLNDDYMSYVLGDSKKQVDEDPLIEKLWMNGDANGMDKSTSKVPENLVKLMRALREDRNPHMADVAESYLKNGKGPCFFVVGAAHLIGNEGVIALLQNRGYTVFQL